MTYDARDETHPALYAPLAGAEGCETGARSARRWPSEGPSPQTPARKEAIDLNHVEFALRAQRRLEETADRLEGEGRGLGIAGEASKISVRARELRVAALLVREEAEAASEYEERPGDPGAPPLESQA